MAGLGFLVPAIEVRILVGELLATARWLLSFWELSETKSEGAQPRDIEIGRTQDHRVFSITFAAFETVSS